MLTPERTNETRFVVALNIEHLTGETFQTAALTCAAGSAVIIAEPETRTIIAFARDGRGIKITDEIETDALWIVAVFRDNELRNFATGEATRVWLGKQLRFASTAPASVEMDAATWRLSTQESDWISLWTPSMPKTTTLDDQPAAVSYNTELRMLRVFVPCGETKIGIEPQ
jgi:hypothetical protein